MADSLINDMPGGEITDANNTHVIWLQSLDGTTNDFYGSLKTIVGSMFSGGTYNGLTVTYQAGDATIDFEVDGVLQDLDTLGANSADGEFLVGTGAGALAWESGATARTSMGVGTGDSPQFTGIELGHASDTTIARASAGVASIEGVNIVTTSGTATFTNKTFDANGTGNSLSNVEVADMAAAAVVLESEGISSNDNDTSFPTSAAVVDYVTGKQSMWIPASAMVAATTSGPAAAQTETSTNKINFETLAFDKDADEYAHFSVAFPKEWNEGTVTFQVWWTAATGGTTGVAWGLQGVAIGDNVTSDTAYGTGVVVTDDAQTGALEVYVTAESGAVTIGNTPAVDEVCFFRLYRDVSDANDDLAEDALLIGMKLFFTTDAPTSD